MNDISIIYHGPRDRIDVGGYGYHLLNEVKRYPADFAEELLRTSVKQHFKAMAEPHELIAKRPKRNTKHRNMGV